MRLYAELVKGDADRDKQIQVIAHRGLHAQLEQHRDCAAETLLAWLQQTTQGGLATGNMPAHPADLERVLLLHTAKRRSRRGPCTCSKDTARWPAGTNRRAQWNRQADKKGSWGRDTAGSRGIRAPCRSGSPFCTIRHRDRRRPRRRARSRMCPKGPAPEPLGRADCCTPRRAAAGRPPRQPTKASFAFYFPPEKRIEFDPGPARPGGHHRGIYPTQCLYRLLIRKIVHNPQWNYDRFVVFDPSTLQIRYNRDKLTFPSRPTRPAGRSP